MENSRSHNVALSDNSLQFRGKTGYRIDGNRVFINVDEIHNDRFDNISGTLSLELWALAAPYQSGSFAGSALAGTQIGELCGQHFLQNCVYELNFQLPAPGTWNLCLMLREWDGQSFTTRDAVNFAAPFTVEGGARANVAVSRDDNSNIIKVVFNDKSAEPAVSTAAADLQVEPVTTADKKNAVQSEFEKAPVSTKSSEKGAAAVPQAKPKTAAKTKEAAAVGGLISVNNASSSQLEAIKGVSKKVAKGIEDGRPYKKLEELLKVKGLGKKLLDKILNQIKL